MSKKLSILLVEDYPINRNIFSSLLIKNGFLVSTAQNGLDAIDLSRENHFDIILMNVNMPIMGGIEAAKEIKKNKPQRIIAYTARIYGKDMLDKTYFDETIEGVIDFDLLIKKIKNQ